MIWIHTDGLLLGYEDLCQVTSGFLPDQAVHGPVPASSRAMLCWRGPRALGHETWLAKLVAQPPSQPGPPDFGCNAGGPGPWATSFACQVGGPSAGPPHFDCKGGGPGPWATQLRLQSWWLSWPVGVVLGTAGFLVRVLVLSLLVGENLWVVITRAGASLLDRLIAVLHLPITPDLTTVQLMALALVVIQEVVYVVSLHALAFWIFPRLRSPIPEPPRLLHALVALDPL